MPSGTAIIIGFRLQVNLPTENLAISFREVRVKLKIMDLKVAIDLLLNRSLQRLRSSVRVLILKETTVIILSSVDLYPLIGEKPLLII